MLQIQVPSQVSTTVWPPFLISFNKLPIKAPTFCSLLQITQGLQSCNGRSLRSDSPPNSFSDYSTKVMGKKRKHSEAEAATREKEEEVAPERPKRTLSGWKENKDDQVNQTESATFFRDKEKMPTGSF
ncbi:hypothetical protein PRUPE_7G132600 [Prunus persica]|uniref:Uncharacterized protein n=1 Tax=Prunus persica TaxID=3760 RepID=A0A251NAX1_PRUPE|nr:hypothetical protein PRUPE_7G132600 [Prunus persica]